jgi:FtsP/CotA-like multicopper oxidase with cupredoxin domain
MLRLVAPALLAPCAVFAATAGEPCHGGVCPADSEEAVLLQQRQFATMLSEGPGSYYYYEYYYYDITTKPYTDPTLPFVCCTDDCASGRCTSIGDRDGCGKDRNTCENICTRARWCPVSPGNFYEDFESTVMGRERENLPVDHGVHLQGQKVPGSQGQSPHKDFVEPREMDCGTEVCELVWGKRKILSAPGGTDTYARGFDGVDQFPIGPTLRVRPGDTLKVLLKNAMEDPSPGPHELLKERKRNGDASDHGKGMKKGKAYIGYLNHTNLHTHGLHVSGSIFEEGDDEHGKRTEDYIWASVGPGQKRRYDIRLPPDHMGGLGWYHAHAHHSTAFQAGAGSAGMIVVEDPPGYFEKAGIPEITQMKEFLMIMTLIDPPFLNTLGSLGGDKIMRLPGDDLTMYVNGQINPTVRVRPGEWVRLRMVYAAVERAIRAQTNSTTGTANCEFQLLAKDGVYLHTMPRKVTSASFWPGARSELAVRCYCPSGESTCSVVVRSQDFGQAWSSGIGEYHDLYWTNGEYDGDIFTFQVAGHPVQSSSLPVVQVPRPCYLVDLRGASVPPSNKHALRLDGTDFQVEWEQTLGSAKKTHSMPDYLHNLGREPGNADLEGDAIGTMTLGQVHEITFHEFSHHPLHIHVNPYQIQFDAEKPDMTPDEYFQAGDWHDVLMVQFKGDAKVRFQTDLFTKQVVFHCHFIRHEDKGMMSFLWIPEPERGAPRRWEGAKAIDPNCYQGPFQS